MSKKNKVKMESLEIDELEMMVSEHRSEALSWDSSSSSPSESSTDISEETSDVQVRSAEDVSEELVFPGETEKRTKSPRKPFTTKKYFTILLVTLTAFNVAVSSATLYKADSAFNMAYTAYEFPRMLNNLQGVEYTYNGEKLDITYRDIAIRQGAFDMLMHIDSEIIGVQVPPGENLDLNIILKIAEHKIGATNGFFADYRFDMMAESSGTLRTDELSYAITVLPTKNGYDISVEEIKG